MIARLLGIVFLLIASAAAAEDPRSIDELRAAAAGGDAEAAYQLGIRYDFGEDVTEDDAEALRWYRRASELGSEDGFTMVGLAYVQGFGGVEIDLDAGLEWLHRGERRGSVMAMMVLCTHYTGSDPPEESDQIFGWYSRCAEKGVARAEHTLGVLYATGDGVAQDDATAARWFRRAAKQGLVHAQVALGHLYDTGRAERRDDIPGKPWYLRGGELGTGVPNSLYDSAFRYEHGLAGLPQDDRAAAMEYRLAAEMGHLESQKALARMYGEGRGVPADVEEARRWLRAAAEQGDEMSAIHYGDAILEEDPVEAVRWYRIQAEKGSDLGRLLLGTAYVSGEGVEKDLVEAYYWYSLIRAGGSTDADDAIPYVEAMLSAEQREEVRRRVAAQQN